MAASVGVEARTSATRSSSGLSGSWPIADTTGVRASTPTDAAKLVVPDVAEETLRIDHLRDRARQFVVAWLAREQHALDTVRARPALADPGSGLAARAVEVHALRDRARRTVHHQLDRAGNDLGHQLARVRGMSPLATLQRGYAVVQDADGHVVTSVEQAVPDRPLRVRVVDGRIAVTVTGAETASLTDPEEQP